jgi:hypothetical protein
MRTKPTKKTPPRKGKIKKRSKNPTKGWAKMSPKKGKERNTMMKKCGSKCFLEPKTKKYPICSKNSCKINKKGLQSAYNRAMQYGRDDIALKSRKKMEKEVKKSRKTTLSSTLLPPQNPRKNLPPKPSVPPPSPPPKTESSLQGIFDSIKKIQSRRDELKTAHDASIVEVDEKLEEENKKLDTIYQSKLKELKNILSKKLDMFDEEFYKILGELLPKGSAQKVKTLENTITYINTQLKV